MNYGLFVFISTYIELLVLDNAVRHVIIFPNESSFIKFNSSYVNISIAISLFY